MMPDMQRRQTPKLDADGFDPRLMTAERLYRLAGKIPVRFSGLPGGIITDRPQFLDCHLCGKGIEQLNGDEGESYVFDAAQLLSNILRHMVMRHDLPLSGGTGNGTGDGAQGQAAAAGGGGGVPGGHRGGGAVHRPGREAADHRGVQDPEGDGRE